VSKLPVCDGGGVTEMLKLFVALVWANIIPPVTSSSKQNILVLMFVIALLYCADVTSTVNEPIPSAVGVPEITPAGESVNPAGSAPELIDQVYG
jgi:hypothetical protein